MFRGKTPSETNAINIASYAPRRRRQTRRNTETPSLNPKSSENRRSRKDDDDGPATRNRPDRSMLRHTKRILVERLNDNSDGGSTRFYDCINIVVSKISSE